jgi:hypothetical protein
MKLSDVVGASGLSGYAEIALIIFFIVFVTVVVRVLFTRSASLQRAAHLPLEDEPTAKSSSEEQLNA